MRPLPTPCGGFSWPRLSSLPPSPSPPPPPPLPASLPPSLSLAPLLQVPTMAIEKVYINCNTSIVQDEARAPFTLHSLTRHTALPHPSHCTPSPITLHSPHPSHVLHFLTHHTSLPHPSHCTPSPITLHSPHPSHFTPSPITLHSLTHHTALPHPSHCTPSPFTLHSLTHHTSLPHPSHFTPSPITLHSLTHHTALPSYHHACAPPPPPPRDSHITHVQILAHRLGLIPIAADPRLFKMPPTSEWEGGRGGGGRGRGREGGFPSPSSTS